MDQLIKSIYRVDLNLQEMRQLTRNNASIVLYDNLTINDNILDVIGKTRLCVLLFPTQSGSPNGHYLGIMSYPEINTVLHWDSYGLGVEQEMRYSTSRHVQSNTLGQLYQKFRNQGGKVIFNTYRYQQMLPNVNTCGRFVVIRLMFSKLTEYQFARMMLNQHNSPDYMVTMMTMIKLYKNDSKEEEIINNILNIKS